jgi:hypothetical protein
MLFLQLNRHLLKAIVASHGLHGIRNPNVLEVSLNKSFWEHQNKDHKSPVTPSNMPPQDTGAACRGPDLPPTQLHQYTRSGCLTAPCVKVVTINIVQSTYEVPTFNTSGGDIHALNNLCKYRNVPYRRHVPLILCKLSALFILLDLQCAFSCTSF